MTMGFAFFQRIAAPFPVTLAVSAILGMAAAGAALGAVASASPWIASTSSKVRLVSGTVDLDGKPTLLAGVQLRMNPGWKTYWKNPGDSGVPPSFDWAGSKNLKHAELLYPAPHRFADANGMAIGYDDEVVFPVRLALAADAGKGDALLLENFLARVPKPAKSGALPEVSGVEAKLDGDAPKLVVNALFPPGATGTDLFIDGGDVFVPVPEPGPLADGRQRFAVIFASPSESAAVKGKTLALTLVSDQGSTETMWTAEKGASWFETRRPAG